MARRLAPVCRETRVSRTEVDMSPHPKPRADGTYLEYQNYALGSKLQKRKTMTVLYEC